MPQTELRNGGLDAAAAEPIERHGRPEVVESGRLDTSA